MPWSLISKRPPAFRACRGMTHWEGHLQLALALAFYCNIPVLGLFSFWQARQEQHSVQNAIFSTDSSIRARKQGKQPRQGNYLEGIGKHVVLVLLWQGCQSKDYQQAVCFQACTSSATSEGDCTLAAPPRSHSTGSLQAIIQQVAATMHLRAWTLPRQDPQSCRQRPVSCLRLFQRALQRR